jgi:hypothetical protein
MRRSFLALAVLLVTACTGGTPAATNAPASPATPRPQASTAAGPSGSAAPAIVGEWVGTHDCGRIVKILTDAGLEEFLGDAIYGNVLVPGVDPSTTTVEDPTHICDDAVQRAHSHFFTASGQFGSKDFNGQQVDDGAYRLEDDDVIVINDQPFHYTIDGDELTLEPPTVDTSSCTTKECRFTATWVLMVSMPGTTWTRGEIPHS